jgi:hypothetical protein
LGQKAGEWQKYIDFLKDSNVKIKGKLNLSRVYVPKLGYKALVEEEEKIYMPRGGKLYGN